MHRRDFARAAAASLPLAGTAPRLKRKSISGGQVITVKDFENNSKLPNLAAGLRRRGWFPAEVDQVLGNNWIRVYEKVGGA